MSYHLLEKKITGAAIKMPPIKIFYIIFALVITGSQAENVHKVEVKTADCEDCGMSLFGQLSIKVGKKINFRGHS